MSNKCVSNIRKNAKQIEFLNTYKILTERANNIFLSGN